MALYSMNRVSSIAAVQEAQAVMEENELNAIMAELDECAYDEDAMGLIETCIVIEETDHKMFDALIEKDFITVQNESVLTEADAAEANEKADGAAKAGLKDKIKKIITTVIEAIKNAFAWIMKKLGEIEANFKQGMIDKISDKFSSVKIHGRKIKAKVAETIVKENDKAVAEIHNIGFGAISDIIHKSASNGQAYKDGDASSVKDNAAEEINKIVEESIKDKTSTCFEDEGEFTVDSAYINTYCVPAWKNFGETKKMIKEFTSKIIKDLNAARSTYVKDIKKSEDQAAIYKITIAECKGCTKIYNQMKNLVVLEKNEARKAIFAAIKASKGKADDKDEVEHVEGEVVDAKDESALDFFGSVISESCDAYLFA